MPGILRSRSTSSATRRERTRDAVATWLNRAKGGPVATLAGRRSVQRSCVLDRPPPGWYPDPADRFSQRWWDGRDWTSTVGGEVHADPQGSLIDQPAIRVDFHRSLYRPSRGIAYPVVLGRLDGTELGGVSGDVRFWGPTRTSTDPARCWDGAGLAFTLICQCTSLLPFRARRVEVVTRSGLAGWIRISCVGHLRYELRAADGRLVGHVDTHRATRTCELVRPDGARLATIDIDRNAYERERCVITAGFEPGLSRPFERALVIACIVLMSVRKRTGPSGVWGALDSLGGDSDSDCDFDWDCDGGD